MKKKILLVNLGGLGDIVIMSAALRALAEKGLEHLIESMAILRRKNEKTFENTVCIVAGEGERKRFLKNMVKKLGFEGRVVFPGFMQDMPAFLKTLDVFVMPSLLEGQPISLLEAMAAGKPIVASDIDGINETVEDGKEALLVPPGRPDMLAEALRRLLDDWRMADELARAARKKAFEKYSLEDFVKKHEKIYIELAGN